MERSNLYVLSLSVLLFATVVTLVSVNVTHLAVYLGFITIEYIGCSLLYSPKGLAYQMIAATLLVLWAITAVLTLSGLGIGI